MSLETFYIPSLHRFLFTVSQRKVSLWNFVYQFTCAFFKYFFLWRNSTEQDNDWPKADKKLGISKRIWSLQRGIMCFWNIYNKSGLVRDEKCAYGNSQLPASTQFKWKLKWKNHCHWGLKIPSSNSCFWSQNSIRSHCWITEADIADLKDLQ